MIQLNSLTPFLESGKKFKLPSGETYDEILQTKTNTNTILPVKIVLSDNTELVTLLLDQAKN